MSEHSTPEERTELPTDKKMQDLRKEGSLFFSRDLVTITGLIMGVYLINNLVFDIANGLYLSTINIYEQISIRREYTVRDYLELVISTFGPLSPSLFSIVFFVALSTSVATLLQTGFNFKEKWIQLKFSQLNPISGIRRVFSVDSLFNTFKALGKVIILAPLCYYFVKHHHEKMLSLIMIPSVKRIGEILLSTCLSLFWQILAVLAVFGAIDFFYGKHRWLTRNKMTKQEVKDERKNVEGDEATKKKIIAKGLQRIVQRLRQTVPEANLIVTNPTHFAVAIQYKPETMRAPIVIAKGQDELAKRIIQIGRESGVTIIERKPLARALYFGCKVGDAIPNELYRVVADLFTYLMKIGKFKMKKAS